MPELPEVETTRRGIAPQIVGRRVRDVRIYDRRLRQPVPANLERLLQGRRIDAVERRSRYLLFRMDTGTLLVHFGMTGSLRAYAKLPARVPHDHLDIVFDSGVALRYHDPRRFGLVLWIPAQSPTHPLLAELGPEPLEAGFNAKDLQRALRGRTAAIKLALMDNRIVCGVGNIYANESLFRARIRPTTAAGRVSRARLARLVEEVRATLTEAIASGGSTLRDYVDSEGTAGSFQLSYCVYGREGLPCRVCGTAIRAVRQGGRTSFYCPRCQRR